MDPLGPTARRFPLVPRPRPACIPLADRVAELSDRARAADRKDDPAAASAVFNLSALLASDVGLPELAREWCHRHAALYLRARPLNGQAAIRALEPLVNLARLHTRNGNGERAITLLESLYTAVHTRADTTIDGLDLPAATLTASPDDHQEARRWLWAVLLASGARALATAGRWQDAHAHLSRYKGIGHRILDGRQVAILAHATSGNTDAALTLLGETHPGEPWENAVTACLTALCHPTPEHLISLRQHYDALPYTPDLAVFHTRLALTGIDATADIHHPTARHIAADLIRHTTTTPDGYTARELLADERCTALLTDLQTDELTTLITTCALGTQTISPSQVATLNITLGAAEAVLTRTLDDDQPPA